MTLGSVLYVNADTRGHCLIISTPMVNEYRLIWFDPVYSFPIFTGIPNIDVFATKDAALESIKQKYNIVSCVEAVAFAGMKIIMDTCHLVLITRVEKRANIAKTHEVYAVVETRVISFSSGVQSRQLTGDSSANTIFLQSFPKKQFYFCNSLDLSSPVNGELNTRMVWNYSMIKPFIALNNEDLCVKLMRGYVFQSELREMKVCALMRIRVAFVVASVDTVRQGDVQNESEIELIVEKDLKHVIETMSFVSIKCSSPTASVDRDEEASTNTCSFLDRIITSYGFESMVLYDLSHNETTHSEHYMVESLENIVQLLSKDMKITYSKNDWDCLVKKHKDAAFKAIQTTDANMQFTQAYWSVGIPDISSKQSMIPVFCCKNGVGRSNSAAFVFNLTLLRKALERASIDCLVEAENFLVRAFLIFADCSSLFIKNKLYKHKQDLLVYGTTTTSEDTLEPVNGRFTEWNQLFSGYSEFFVSPESSPLNGISLVSMPPSSYVVLPENFDDNIFDLKLTKTWITQETSRISIFLSKPSTITSISFFILRAEDIQSYASFVSFYGGNHLNRLFPLATNLCLPYATKSPTIATFLVDQTASVRYLSIQFSAFLYPTVIGNIFIYGVPSSTIPQVASIETEPKLSSLDGPVNVTSLLKWEESRLAQNISKDDFLIYKIMQGVSPSSVSLDVVLAKCSMNTERLECTHCHKAMINTVCAVCQKPKCEFCLQKASKEFKWVCSECITEFKERLAYLSKLEAYTSYTQYPFKFKKLPELSPGQFAQGWFLFEPPVGIDGLPADCILSGSGKTWKPGVSMVPLTVIFQKGYGIDSITIECENDLVVKINKEKLLFKAPVSTRKINICLGKIEMILIGQDISISSLKFSGLIVQLPLTISQKNDISKRVDFRMVQVSAKFSPSELRSVIEFPKTMTVCGLNFDRVPTADSIFVEVGSQTKHVFKMRLPSKLISSGPHQVLFESQIECDALSIWYYNTEPGFIVPIVKALTCELEPQVDTMIWSQPRRVHI